MKLNDLKYRGVFQPDALHHTRPEDALSALRSRNEAAKKMINKKKKRKK